MKKFENLDQKKLKYSGTLNSKLIQYLNAFDRIKEWYLNFKLFIKIL
jgi:hypothetical protein